MSKIDVAAFIRERDAKLDPVRLALKYEAMRKNPFAFFRATCALFNQRLPKLGRLMHAPPAWSCGDAHTENFGTFRASNGLVYIDLNDFDEALLAPCSFDILRLCASVAMAKSALGLSKTREAELMTLCVVAYATALAKGKVAWIERDSATGAVGRMVNGLKGRSRQDFLDKRTYSAAKTRKIRIDNVHAIAAPDSEKTRVARLLEQWARKKADEEGRKSSFFDVVDVALRISGLGSLGTERYIVLVTGEGVPDDMRLMDIKRARPSAVLEAADCRQPPWSSEAERVCTIQKRMQVRSPAFLDMIIDRSRSYVIRELQPREDRLDLALVSSQPDGLENAVAIFGRLLAWAHLRSAGRQGSAPADDLIHFAQKTKWQDRLLDTARQCAAICQEDWTSFCRAHDKGAFTLGSSGSD